MKQTIEEKIYHLLLGIAYGDALGMPTENLNRQDIKQTFGVVAHLVSSSKNKKMNRKLSAGKVTDDTENSVFICQMLIKTKGKVDKNLFVKYLIRWIKTDPNSSSVIGPSTKKAILAIERRVGINQAGITGTTNGAAMKIAPIGLVSSYQNIPQLVKNVAEICIPTHNTKIAIQGASIIAVLVSYIFSHKKVNWKKLYKIIYKTALDASKYGNPLPTPNIVKRIKYGKYIAKNFPEKKFLDELYSFLGTGMQTIQTVPAAVSLVYRYQNNLRKITQVCANLGGDTDTIGAICGAISGINGFNLTQKEISLLKKQNSINFRKLALELAPIVKEKRDASHADK